MCIETVITINSAIVSKIFLMEKSSGNKTALIATPLFNARKIFTPTAMSLRTTIKIIAILIDQNTLFLDSLLLILTSTIL